MFDWPTIPQLLVYGAGAFYVLGLLIINQVALRLMVLMGTGLYLFYYATVADEPLWEAMYISVLIGIANIIGLGGLMAGRSKLSIPRKHADIYPFFPTLPPGHFRKLMRHVNRYVLEEDTVLTVQGEPVENLYFVISGKTYLEKTPDCFQRPPGNFVGEVAYLTGMSASATTMLTAGSEVLAWNNSLLRATAARSTPFMLALGSILSLDMARKVSDSVVPTARPADPNTGPALHVVL